MRLLMSSAHEGMHYIIKQGTFEGPLDLLLKLVQDRELAINEISLARVTDDFIHYLQTLKAGGKADAEVLAEFLVIAATLLLIKSQSLLPQFAAAPEEEASIAELEERLAEYQRMKGLAAKLGEMAAGGPKLFSREAYVGLPPAFRPPKGVTLPSLARAFQSVLAAVPKMKTLAEEKLKKIISLEEKIRELQAFLQERVERAFSELVAGAKEHVEVIVSFLALLELAKQKLVSVEQREPFGDITIRRATVHDGSQIRR